MAPQNFMSGLEAALTAALRAFYLKLLLQNQRSHEGQHTSLFREQQVWDGSLYQQQMQVPGE